MANKEKKEVQHTVYLTKSETEELERFCEKSERSKNNVFRLGMKKVMRDEFYKKART